MKKLMYLLVVLIVFSVSSCETTCKPISKPKDLQPIDWENYNDAYTVFWNVVRNNDDAPGYAEYRKIKVFGWIPLDSDGMSLTDNPAYATKHFPAGEINRVLIEIMGISKKDTVSKCFVEGTISAQPIGPNVCRMRVTMIAVDTIYYE